MGKRVYAHDTTGHDGEGTPRVFRLKGKPALIGAPRKETRGAKIMRALI